MIIVLSSDVDFVSDDVLEIAYQNLSNVPLTIFQTHYSDYLFNAFKKNKKWEAEIHPNFCSNSTQGNNIIEVVNYFNNINNKGLGFRSHRYYTSNDVEEILMGKNYRYVSNVCTDLELVKPFKLRSGLIEFPIFFEDGGYLKYHGVPCLDDILSQMKEDGIYVFNFHPIHLALNSNDFNFVRKIKDSLTVEEYQNLNIDLINKYQNTSYGIRDFLNDLIKYAINNSIPLKTLEECFNEF